MYTHLCGPHFLWPLWHLYISGPLSASEKVALLPELATAVIQHRLNTHFSFPGFLMVHSFFFLSQPRLWHVEFPGQGLNLRCSCNLTAVATLDASSIAQGQGSNLRSGAAETLLITLCPSRNSTASIFQMMGWNVTFNNTHFIVCL